MTRKNSRVKALALAVTCAILAGGYSGVGTVYAASAAIVYSSDNTHDGNTSINGTLTVKGSLTLKEQASDTSDALEYLDIARLSKINHLINYSANGTQTVITAGDGSTIGGVGFTAGALTGVTSINAGTSNSKFSVDTNGAISAVGGNFKVGENNMKLGYLTITATNDGVKFTDTNRSKSFTILDIDTIDYRTETVGRGFDSTGNVKDTFTSLGDKLKVYDKHSVYDNSTNSWSENTLDLVTIKGDLSVDSNNGSRIVTEDNSKFYVKGSDGSLKAADGKFNVKADGSINANNKFVVDEKGAITAAGDKFYVKEDGKVQIEDELVISHAGSGTEADPGKSATLNIDNLTAINKLIKVTDGVNPTVVYDTNGKPVITAGDGSTIGGVTISGGQLSVSQGTVNVTDLVKDHKLVNDDYKGNERLNSRINSLETSDASLSKKTQAIERVLDLSDNLIGTKIENKLYVYNDGTVTINENTTQQVTIDSDGIKVGKNSSDADPTAANSKFYVDASNGKLVSASGSRIGDVTIDGESLSYGTSTIKVSELASDHALVNDATKGNEQLYHDINLVREFANGIDDRVGGITRADDPSNSSWSATIIEENFKVENNGIATISEGFKAGADGKNSLTITGLKTTEIRAGNSNTEFFVDGGGNVVAAGTLNAAGGNFDVSSEGNITARGFLSVAGDKFRVNADGSINANNKFNIDADGALRAANDKFTADKEGNVRAIGTLSAANEKFRVGTDGSINVNQKFIVNSDGTIYSDGTLSVAGGKFVVNSEGVVTAGSMKMDNIEAASGSKIGDVTINGESLSNGTKSIKVSELADDHSLVNDSKKGNESLYTGLGSVQTLAQGLNTKTAGIERDTTGTAATTIEGKLKVSSDGTVKINEGEDQQVIIDSNGIKVGKNSARMNDSYGFATTKDLYIGADNADAPTAAGSKFYVKGSDGSIKAANGKFTVDENGDITASGLTTKKINAGKSSATDPEFMVDEDGNLTSKGKLSAAGGLFSVDEHGALSVGNGAFSVDSMGSVVTSGSVSLRSGANNTQLTAGGISFTQGGTTTTIAGDKVTVSGSTGSKSFYLSDIADVGQNMTNLGNRIEAEENKRAQEVSRLDTAINDEKTKRAEEVSRLDTAINDEKTKRAEEVSRLDTAINDEKTKREQDVADLNGRVDAVNSRVDSINNDFNTAINDEKTKREQEVSRLDTAINEEKTKREQEVSRLDTAINDEKTKREQDVADLNGRVDAVNSRVDSINNDFNTAINDEKTKREQEVSRLDTAINDEKTKREQEVTRLDGRIDTVNTAISDEKTKREQEVTRLDGRIDTVSNNLGDLNKLDSDLTAREEYTGNSSVVGGINAEAAVRKEEVTRLDNAIADEAAARQADVARLDGRISDVSSRINKVGAMAAAISSLKTMGYDPESPTEFSVGLGQYKGETGVALGFFHYPNKNFMINVSLSTSSGEIMGGIGATWRFGHKSPQKLLEEQRAAQAEKEIAAAEAYKAARAAKQTK